MRRLFRCCIAATCLSLFACRSPQLFDEGLAMPPESSLIKPVSRDVSKSDVPVKSPTDQLTLQQAIALSLEYAPALQAGRLHIQSMQAQAKYAGNWSNPELEIELENFAGSGDFSGTKSLETTFSLAQSFPLGHDLQYMQRIAGQESELAAWDQQAKRLALLMQVTQRYIQAQTAQQRLVQSSQSLELVKQVYDLTRKRIEAGVSPQVELTRSAVQVAQMQMAHQQASRQRDAALLQLALLWGQTHVTFDRVQNNLASLGKLPELAQLFKHIQQNPQIARWSTQISKRHAEYQLARAQAIPDLVGKLGYRHANETDDHALVVGFSLPLPLFDRNQGPRLASRLRMQSVLHEKRQVQLQLQQNLTQAYTQLATSHDMAKALHDDALPKATDAFKVTSQAYQQGDVQFIDVIDAQKTLNDLQSQYLDALGQYHMAAAWIESMTCQSLAKLSRPNLTDTP